jgi:hypothetical protein
MINKQSLYFLQLILMLLFFKAGNSQKIGVVEKTNYPSWDTKKENHSNKYFTVLRDLFEKKDSTWYPVYNWDSETQKLKKYKTEYVYQLNNKNHSIIGNINHTEKFQSTEQFIVSKFLSPKLNRLPKTIIDGFEDEDIIASLIVSDKKVKKLIKPFFKTEKLSNTLKTVVYETIISQFKRCFNGFEDSTDRIWIQESYIDSNIRLLPYGLRLGKVYIPPNNNCFTGRNSAYGGGILHYIIYPNMEVKLLVTNTELIDVGDFDNDGNLEYIFMKSWFNNYGYVLYYNNFQKEVKYEWSYH